jgi:hypothetical protein
LGMHPIELYCSITISIINNSRKTERWENCLLTWLGYTQTQN